MKNATRNLFLIVLSILLLAVLVGCNQDAPVPGESENDLQIKTLEFFSNAYLNEAFDLRDILTLEDGVSYSATACYVQYTLEQASNQYTSIERVLEVTDLCFTPTEIGKVVVTITATRDGQTASKVVIIPTTIRADPLDDILYSGGTYSLADPGISKRINMDPAYLMGEGSKTSLYVTFNGVDPHPWGNTFIALDKEEVQRHFTDQTWKNSILTFWVYNPNEKAVEFQLRIADPISGIDIDWSTVDGPNKQIAQPGQWTQLFFPLRKLGFTKPVTSSQYVSCAVNVKVRYEDYSTTDSYSYNFYVDGIDVVDSSVYPDIDNKYVLSDETLEQGWENMAQDTGWQGVYTEYGYENIQGENSTCSLKAYFNNDKAMTNSFICLATEMDSRFTELPDMTGGKFSAYFKFENMDTRVSLDIVNKSWTTSNQVDFALKSVGDGWYYGEVDLEDIQVGTGRNDQIIRIRLNFHGVSQNSVVYVDTCKFEYKYVHKVLESVSADWINMVADTGSAYYYTVKSEFVTSHLQGGNTVRSLKLVAPAGDQGRYTLNTDQAAINGEISVVPNMNKGTLGAWFYFGDQIPEAYAFITNNQWHSSNWIDFIFTENAGNGWYYGQINASGFTCSEGGGTSTAIRIALVIPAGYMVYVDNLSWKAGVEKELVSADVPKPGSGKYSFEAGRDLEISLKIGKPIKEFSFEYKIESGEAFNIALMPNWNEYFGYFAFNAQGSVDPYAGITCQVMEDGVVHVTMDMTAVTKYVGNPSKVIDFVYLRGNWTNASGYIENIDYVIDENAGTEEPTEPPAEGEYVVVAGEDLIIDLEVIENLTSLSFDYKVTSGTFNMALMMSDWGSYYGYYAFNGAGNVDPYDGVTVTELEDGYFRVTFQIAALSKTSGTPNAGFTMLYVRGAWTDATGVIKNITLNAEDVEEPTEPDDTEPTEPTEPEGTQYNVAAGEDLIIDLDVIENLTSLSFDYKVTSGTFNMALMMSDWGSYYGYYAFNGAGNVDPYDGVTLETLGDGFIRVTFDIAALTKASGTPNAEFSIFYVRGGWTDATGVIKNITLNAEEIEEPTEPDVTEPTEPTEPESTQYNVAAGEDLIIDLDVIENLTSLSFDYKVTSGTFNMALMMSDWGSYYGYYAFNGAGNVDPYDGVTVTELEDGYFRVTFQIAALTKTSGTPNAGFTMLYVRGAWTDATGVIKNITLNAEEVEEPTEPDVTEPTEPESTQYNVAAGEDLIIDLDVIENLTSLSFDYKVTSGTFNMALMMSDWGSYYGYYAFNGAGNVDPYDGVTLETLGDGFIRVTFDIAALTKASGTPNAEFSIFYVRGGWTDAAGVIKNITLNSQDSDKELPGKVLAGTTLAAGADRTILTECTQKLTRLTFDYKITSGEAFNISLNPNWDSYYGYFAFDANGNIDSYDGVTCETLENGYIRVTFDMDALTKFSGTPNAVLEFLYVRGNWTNATGEITNINLYYDNANVLTRSASGSVTMRKLAAVVSPKKLLEEFWEELNRNGQ